MSFAHDTRIELLTDANYATWAVVVRQHIKARGLWSWIDGSRSYLLPVASSAEEGSSKRAMEIDKDARDASVQCYGLILSLMTPSLQRRWDKKTLNGSPKMLWDAFTAEYVIQLDILTLQKQLYETRLEDHGTVLAYIDEIERIITDLESCNRYIDAVSKFFFIYNGLPASWHIWRQVVRQVIAIDKPQELIKRMRAQEAEERRTRGLTGDQALFVKSRRGRNGNASSSSSHGGNNSANNGNNGRRPPLKCFNCNEIGHIAMHCTNKRKTGGSTGGSNGGSRKPDKAYLEGS